MGGGAGGGGGGGGGAGWRRRLWSRGGGGGGGGQRSAALDAALRALTALLGVTAAGAPALLAYGATHAPHLHRIVTRLTSVSPLLSASPRS
jgi:hypothetical protein